MDALEIAHSITVEAIRAGVNRPDEILSLFESLTTKARAASLAPPPPTPAPIDEAPEAEQEADEERAPATDAAPAVEEPPSVAAASVAPLPSQAWREPSIEEPPPAAHLSPEDIAASHGLDFIKCLECGQTKQQLKAHLNRIHSLSPEQYKEKWGLPKDYPMIAPATRKRFQERGRRNYEKQKAAGTGMAASPGRGRKPKAA